MTVAKIYLALVSVLYMVLGIWCTVRPNLAARQVGFDLQGGSGQSEFLTVYGGLEVGIALVLLSSLFQTKTLAWSVLACVLIHGSLVFFRAIGFILFKDIESLTYKLAAGEWLIFLVGLGILALNPLVDN